MKSAQIKFKKLRLFSNPGYLPVTTLSSLYLFLLIFGFSASHAQDRRNRLNDLHTSYITEKINLTDAEAQKFWPVYDDYRSAKDELKKQRDDDKAMVNKAGGFDKMTDAQVQKWIADETDERTRELDLEKQYLVKFEQVLPIRKVAKFYLAEDEFKIYLLKQLIRRQQGPPPRQREFVPE